MTVGTQILARESRAVERPIEPGNSAACAHCGEVVKFVARARLRRVIANVYVGGTWVRVEHFHKNCYEKAGKPHGELIPDAKSRSNYTSSRADSKKST